MKKNSLLRMTVPPLNYLIDRPVLKLAVRLPVLSHVILGLLSRTQ